VWIRQSVHEHRDFLMGPEFDDATAAAMWIDGSQETLSMSSSEPSHEQQERWEFEIEKALGASGSCFRTPQA